MSTEKIDNISEHTDMITHLYVKMGKELKDKIANNINDIFGDIDAAVNFIVSLKNNRIRGDTQ